ncbi:Hypothetical predicted protein [Olea europaea subsp. europaea]|uniref:Uncharacterized protein n=1 Tax=Olea europaea subsp. europaea TaxID=158383 RepID=A0A8S0Q7R6_OLEEU|nr:Hypothetical predicted protein [Olea europaea subsp. europaea]
MTDSNDGPVEDIVNLYMNIFLGRSEKKHKARHAKGKGKKKKFEAREVSESVDNLATASREFASVLCSRDKGDNDNRIAYSDAQTSELRFAWIEYYFKRDKEANQEKSSKAQCKL